MKILSRFLLCISFLLFTALNLGATPKTLLVLNSYHEDELWGNSMVQPIISHYAHNDSIKCEAMFLNGANVPDSTVYATISNSVFEQYADRHPDYVLMVGNFAFTLRERMIQEWGDIPFVVVSRSESFGPLSDYFTDNGGDFSIEMRRPFSEVRNQYNFTSVLVPDYSKQTIDMMMHMIPEMETLVFLADESYVNKVCAFNIYNYLLEEYPTVQFKWLSSTEANVEKFNNYLDIRDTKIGLLLSSWTYETMSTRGYPALTTRDLNQISTSVNPIFTMRRAYLDLGCVGGVFADIEAVQAHMLKIVDEMVHGKSMRDVPFYNAKDGTPVVYYRTLEKYGFKESDCPKGTTFYLRPETYFERYWAVILVFAILAIIFIVQLLRRNTQQGKKIDLLRRHRDFVDNMPVPYTCALLTINKDGQISNIRYDDKNRSFDKITSDNSLPADPLRIIPESKLKEIVTEMIKTRQPKTFNHHFTHTDTYYEFTFYPVLVKDVSNAKDLTIDVFARNITSAYKLQMQLSETARVLDLAVDISDIIPYKLNWTTRTLSFDISSTFAKKYHELFQDKPLTLDEYILRVVPEDVHILTECIERVNKGEVTEYSIQYRIKSLEEPHNIIWVDNHGAVVQADADGRPIQIIGSIQNISATKDHEEVMAKALSKAEESDRLKSTFLANMSHEIRTPLNAIVGFSNLMVKEKDDKTKRELAGVISKNSDLLLNLINDVLDIAKIESNDVELSYSVCDINDVISSISKTMTIRIPKGVKLNNVYYADRCVVEADSSRITQILINFLTNACKFTTTGSITVGYEIRHADGMLYFFVRDTGLGIAKENQARIFDQFVKLNNFVQGTGLGLAISRKLVEKMGGQIGVSSDGEGYGSTFWFTVPYMPAEAEVAEEVSIVDTDEPFSDTDDSDVSTEDNAENEEEKPLVLVCEDNPSNFWLMKHILSNKYRVVNARNGLEGVKMFKELNPYLIIMDINMPEMDGYQAVAEIRKLSNTVPIIAVTAYAFASDRVRILNSGFDAYVAKPVTEIAIFTAIAQVTKK